MTVWPKRFHNTSLPINWFSVIIGAGVVALIFARLMETLADPDLWGYLAFGRLFWTGFDFPYTDPFSYLPTKTLWVYHEWLTGVFFYPIFSSLGDAGLQGLKYLIAGITALFIYQTARLRGASKEASVFLLLLISPFFSFAYSPVRAQVFTNLFFVLTLYLLDKSRLTGRAFYLWWLVPIFFAWANLHGGFVAGLGIIGLFAAGEFFARRSPLRYGLILIPILLVTFINPYGWKYWTYLIDALSMPRPNIEEWHSVLTALQNGAFSTNILMFLILLLLAVLMLIKSRMRHFSDIFIVFITALLAFQHVRHQSLFFLVMGCLAPLYFTQIEEDAPFPALKTEKGKKTGRRILMIVFAGIFLFYGLRIVTGHPFALSLQAISVNQASDYNYPVGAVDYIRNHQLKGNILTEFSWGEYILWSLPDSKIAMDGRYETVYPENIAQEYFTFTDGGPGWQNYLSKYPHELILFRQESVAYALVQSLPQWRKVYSDEDCVLLVRDKNRMLR